jgi:hypothetical protein
MAALTIMARRRSLDRDPAQPALEAREHPRVAVGALEVLDHVAQPGERSVRLLVSRRL